MNSTKSLLRTTSSVQKLLLVSPSVSRRFFASTTHSEELRQEARLLTLSLYRRCVRSAYIIRRGNEHDEQEFRDREQKRVERTTQQLTMLSALPPVDRHDELRSRFEYYLNYAHENFVQESDCLDVDEWGNFGRYFQLLKRGEEQRRWLLQDMKFDDPYKETFDTERIERLEKEVLRLEASMSREATDVEEDEEEEASFWGDDEEDADDDEELPPWYQNPRSGN